MIINFILSEKFWLPIIYILVGVFIYFLISRFMDKSLKVSLSNQHLNKKKTIIYLLKNIMKYVIAIIVILAILGLYGVDTTAIIASIGIISVIIGLALQDIIKDFLAGISIVFDNQYTLGDWVEINGFVGEVISLGLTTTKLQAETGEIKIISNAAFSELTNYSLNNSKLFIKLKISYDTDIKKLEKVLKKLEKDILELDNVVGNYILKGIDKLDDDGMLYLISLECKPVCSGTVRREVLPLITKTLLDNNIKYSLPKLEVNIKK